MDWPVEFQNVPDMDLSRAVDISVPHIKYPSSGREWTTRMVVALLTYDPNAQEQFMRTRRAMLRVDASWHL